MNAEKHETSAPQTIELELVKSAIKEFEAAQSKYRKFGANDTEPDGVFQNLINRAALGNGPAVPRTASGWELYASTMDCTEAGNALHDAALKVVQLIEAVPVRDYDALRQTIKNYCWRIY